MILQSITNPFGISYTFLIIPFITVLPIFYYLIKFGLKAKKEHQKMFGYLSMMFFMSLLYHGATLISRYTNIEEVAKSFFLISRLIELISLLNLLLILELFERNRALTTQTIIPIILVAIIFGIFLSGTDLIIIEVENRYIVGFEIGSPATFINLILSLVSIYIISRFFYRTHKNAKDPKQIRLINLLVIGILLSQIIGAFVPSVLREELHINREMYLNMGFIIVIGELTRNIGMIIIGYAFNQVSETPWLLQRQTVHFLSVYSKAGLNIYSKNFDENIDEDDLDLLSGGISAISSMFKDVTKASESIQAILFEGKELRILSRDSFLCAILVEYSTQASQLAMENFVKEFWLKYKKYLENFAGNIDVFKDADEITEKYFS